VEIDSFDPEDDDAHNNTRVKIKRAYQDALEAGLDDEAVYLRQLSHDHQKPFAMLLLDEFVED
jgi:hypothetical protein